MIKYIIFAVIIALVVLADIHVFIVCGEVVGLVMVAFEAVVMARLEYELREFNKEG